MTEEQGKSGDKKGELGKVRGEKNDGQEARGEEKEN